VGYIMHEPGGTPGGILDKGWEDNQRECQRFFNKSNGYAIPALNAAWVYVGTTIQGNTGARGLIQFPVRMAIVPAMTYCGNTTAIGNLYSESAGANIAVSSSSVNDSGVSAFVMGTAAPASLGNGPALLGCWTADTSW
jgi:hypothetical protein